MLGLMTNDKEDKEDKEGAVEHARKGEKYEDLLDDGIDVSPVVKVIEVVATSPESFGDAVAKGITAAARSLRHISGADVKHMTVAVRHGKISQYRVDLKVAFALDADDEEHED